MRKTTGLSKGCSRGLLRNPKRKPGVAMQFSEILKDLIESCTKVLKSRLFVKRTKKIFQPTEIFLESSVTHRKKQQYLRVTDASPLN